MEQIERTSLWAWNILPPADRTMSVRKDFWHMDSTLWKKTEWWSFHLRQKFSEDITAVFAGNKEQKKFPLLASLLILANGQWYLWLWWTKQINVGETQALLAAVVCQVETAPPPPAAAADHSKQQQQQHNEVVFSLPAVLRLYRVLGSTLGLGH